MTSESTSVTSGSSAVRGNRSRMGWVATSANSFTVRAFYERSGTADRCPTDRNGEWRSDQTLSSRMSRNCRARPVAHAVLPVLLQSSNTFCSWNSHRSTDRGPVVFARRRPYWFATIMTQIATTRPEWSDVHHLVPRSPISLAFIFQAYTAMTTGRISRNGPCCTLENAPSVRWWPGA